MSKTYSIVGMNHRKSEDFVNGLQPGVAVVLMREPNNPFDPLAIAVWIDGKHVGYVPKAQNKVLAQFIDQQGAEVASIAMDAIGIEWDPANAGTKYITAKFVRSPNSNYPMVQV